MSIASTTVNENSTVAEPKASADELPPVLIDTSDVNFYYGDFHALKSVSLPLYANRITAMIGPSGCGKSTFLRVLNRMNEEMASDTRLEGRVLLQGQDIYAPVVDKSTLRKRIGMVFQRPNPFPKSIFDNVAYGPTLDARPNRRTLEELVERSLQQAALWDEVKDKLKQSALALSGGQQQRLCIARALATRPEVILMDEPCSALDPNSTNRIEELMLELKKEYTIAIVTHNMQQAARVSDFTAFFLKGVVMEFGPTERLFTSPEKKETDDYIRGRFG
ncbi:MAG: phosphate ABC transporter ATP-binding protein PstB [Capsulimonadales bacterium]|nr:phosphate ABC transporter ATP-binding protein PstB [Capsulimonadales bacterium]